MKYKKYKVIGWIVLVVVILATFRFGGVIELPDFAQGLKTLEGWQNQQSAQNLSSKKEEFAQVVRVFDGDTILLANGQKVRYIGIDSPETGKGYTKKSECFAGEATRRNRELVDGKKVRLVRDVSDVDKYNRLLRYVYVDGQFVNDILVREGFATAKSYKPDTAQTSALFQSMRLAQKQKLGLWSTCD